MIHTPSAVWSQAATTTVTTVTPVIRVTSVAWRTVPFHTPSAVYPDSRQAVSQESSGYDVVGYVPEPRDATKEMEPRKLFLYLVHSRRRCRLGTLCNGCNGCNDCTVSSAS